MIKQLTVCICDICGVTKPAKTKATGYNDYYYDMPEGWTQARGNKHVHLCPECSQKLRQEYGEDRT